MSWPMPADGTIRYSTGNPGRENAPAVAEPPTTPTSPGSAAAVTAATANRRAQTLRIFPTKPIDLPIPFLVVCRTRTSIGHSPRCACSQPHLGVVPLSCGFPAARRSAVEGGDQIGFEGLELRCPISP